MSADGSVELAWAGENRRFRIAIGEFRELQECVNRRRVEIGLPPDGPSGILTSLRTKNAWPDDVRDIIRLGLIGGGAQRIDAARIMKREFDGTPLLQHTKTAFLILLAALVGDPDDEPSKKKIPADRPTTDPLNSPEFTDKEPQ